MLKTIKKLNSMEWVESHPKIFTGVCLVTLLAGMAAGAGPFIVKEKNKHNKKEQN